MKEFLRWMQAGLAGIAIAVVQYATGGGNPVSLKSIGTFVLSALLVRAAGWVTAKVPVTPPTVGTVPPA